MLKQLNLRNITVDIYHRTKRAVVNYDNEPILVIKGWENPPDEDYITNYLIRKGYSINKHGKKMLFRERDFDKSFFSN